MFGRDGFGSSGDQPLDREPVLSAATITGWVEDLAEVDRDASDAERVDQIAELERLKAAAAAAQARLTADLDASQRAAQEAAGVPKRRVGVGIASQVALARRETPHLGQRHLGLAKVLVHEMPHTLAALERGRLGEWQATLLARETGHLTLEHRQHVDRILCADPEAPGSSSLPPASSRWRWTPRPWSAATAGPRRSAGSGSGPPPTP